MHYRIPILFTDQIAVRFALWAELQFCRVENAIRVPQPKIEVLSIDCVEILKLKLLLTNATDVCLIG